MKPGPVFMSMLSAFGITTFGSLSVAILAARGNPGFWCMVMVVGTGICSAFKDYRSSMRLPPVAEPAQFGLQTEKPEPITLPTTVQKTNQP